MLTYIEINQYYIYRCLCVLPFTWHTLSSATGFRAELPAALVPRGPGTLRGQCHATGGCHGHRGSGGQPWWQWNGEVNRVLPIATIIIVIVHSIII